MTVEDQILEGRARSRVIAFFSSVGARVTLMKPTLSRLLQMGYPTLELEREGRIEKNPMTPDGWRVVRGFAFAKPSPEYPSPARTRSRSSCRGRCDRRPNG